MSANEFNIFRKSLMYYRGAYYENVRKDLQEIVGSNKAKWNVIYEHCNIWTVLKAHHDISRLPDCDSQILILIACWSNQNWLFSTILPMVTSLSLLHDFFNIIGFYCSLYYFFRFALSFSNPFHFIGKQQFPDITLPHIFLVTTPQNGFIAGLDYWPDLFWHWWLT